MFVLGMSDLNGVLEAGRDMIHGRRPLYAMMALEDVWCSRVIEFAIAGA